MTKLPEQLIPWVWPLKEVRERAVISASDVGAEVLKMREAIQAIPKNKQPEDKDIPFSSNKLASEADPNKPKLRALISRRLRDESNKPNPLLVKQGTDGAPSYALTELGKTQVGEYRAYLVQELVTRASKNGFDWIKPEGAAVLLQHEGKIDKIGINGIRNNDLGIVEAIVKEIASFCVK